MWPLSCRFPPGTRAKALLASDQFQLSGRPFSGVTMFALSRFISASDVSEAALGAGYEGAVAEAERSLIRRKPPSDLTAYDTYLLGMEAKHKVTKEGLDEGERLFRKALEIDPELARAYVGLAYIYGYKLDLGPGTCPLSAISGHLQKQGAELWVQAQDSS